MLVQPFNEDEGGQNRQKAAGKARQPPNGIGRPPSFTYTFGDFESALMLSLQVAKRSSRFPL